MKRRRKLFSLKAQHNHKSSVQEERESTATKANQQARCLTWLLALAVVLALGSPSLALSYGGQQQQQQSIAGLQQSMAQMLQVFNGNDSQPIDLNHFKLMEYSGDFLLLGARNVVYNLSLSTMRELRRLEWPSSEEDVKMCRVKGKSTEQCQNYIRVLRLQSPDTLFVCGTNAYKPRCRTYLITSNAYELVSEAPGEGACPYQENQNVTSLFVDGDLYSATAAQFSGIDGLIHRAPLRTEQFNPKQLNSPNFVSSFRYGEHVYFLFRESAVEHTNCGKTIYSRVARVCINDSGGQTRANRERWTSFVKARLNCSIPGEYPFYFNEIQASTQIISSASGARQQMAQAANSPQNNDLLYAVFTTPTNSIGGSAVCAFRMADIMAAFDGPFKAQADSNSNWLPVPESRVPQPRPGTCVNDSKHMPDENINFIKDNPLMDTAIEAVWSQPIIMMASINFRFTQIAVDPQVETRLVPGASSMRTDVIFVSTDDGRVFKLINTYHLQHRATSSQFNAVAAPLQQQANLYGLRQPQQQFDSLYGSARLPMPAPQVMTAAVAAAARDPLPDISSSTVVIEELHLFDSRTPIVNMHIHYPAQSSSAAERGHYSKLIVLSGKQLKSVPLSRCERALTCADCLALYDPYCAWDLRMQVCFSAGRSPSSEQFNYQHPRMNNWFPANNLANNHTLAWWQQCPTASEQPQVGPPFRSLFSSHLQVPSRFDYASGHHLSHTALVSLSTPANGGPPGAYYRQQPVSECLTYCGGLYTPQQASSGTGSESSQIMMNCADYVQQHYIGNLQSSVLGAASGQSGNGNLYTSENVYMAVIICAIFGLILGLGFGFALGRNSRKHDSSICSSTFDETNLYMASTGSHHNAANLFAQQQRLHHPLLQQTISSNGLLTGINGIHRNSGHPFNDSSVTNSLLGQDHNHSSSNYGNQQQMLLNLSGNINQQQQLLPNSGSVRNGALPPLPGQQQAPLVNTSSSSTHINHSQLTPNSIASSNQIGGSGTASSTNTSSTSTTAPATDQLYLNQQQLIQTTPQQNLHNTNQRSFGSIGGASLTGKSGRGLMQQQQQDTLGNKLTSAASNGKNSFLQQQTQLQQQQQQQQNNKIYL